MASYNRAKELAMARNERMGGRNIWVDNISGSDSAPYDGSYGYPYATIVRGAADLRSGRGDILWIRGTGTAYSPSSLIQLTNLDDVAIIGVGNLTINPPASFPTFSSGYPVGVDIARISNTRIQIDFDAAHGVSIGQIILLDGWSTQWPTRKINGPWTVVGNTPSTRLTLDSLTPWTVAGGASASFFGASHSMGTFWGPMSWYFLGCSNLILDGLNFEGSGTNKSQLIWITENVVSTFNKGRRVLIASCNFTNTCLMMNSREELGAAASLFNPAIGISIEENIFATTAVEGTIFSRMTGMPMLCLDGGNETVIQSNLFQRVPVGATQLMPTVKGSIRFFGREPKSGIVITANTVGDNLTAVEFYGAQDPQGVFSEHPDSALVTATRNFYSGEPGQVKTIALPGWYYAAKQDTEAASYIDQDIVPSHSDLMFGLDPASAVLKPGTMGDAFVKSVLYADGVHIDMVNGTAGAVLGENGLKTSPVDNITDARTIADAAGVQKYTIVNAPSGTPVVLNAAHQDWSFVGAIGPVANVVNVNGQDVGGSAFDLVSVTGTIVGVITVREGTLGTVSGLQGVLRTVGAGGTITMSAGTVLNALDFSAQNLVPGITIDLNNGGVGTVFLGAEMKGNWTIKNVNGLCIVGISMDGGTITLDSSITGGIIQIYGNGEIINNAAGGTITIDVVRGSRIDAAISSRASAAEIASVQSDTDDIQTRLPAALVGGRMDSSVGAMATDTLDANALAADAIAEIQSGLATASALTIVSGDVAAVAADVERLYGRNVRTRLWYANAAIVSGQAGALRNVPSGSVSHMESQVKTDAQADWSSPTIFYVVFNYAADAVATTTPPASAEPDVAAPSDGTFSAEPYPA